MLLNLETLSKLITRVFEFFCPIFLEHFKEKLSAILEVSQCQICVQSNPSEGNLRFVIIDKMLNYHHITQVASKPAVSNILDIVLINMKFS